MRLTHSSPQNASKMAILGRHVSLGGDQFTNLELFGREPEKKNVHHLEVQGWITKVDKIFKNLLEKHVFKSTK